MPPVICLLFITGLVLDVPNHGDHSRLHNYALAPKRSQWVYAAYLQKMVTKPNQSLGYRSIPSFLRRLREDAGLTQRELGQRLKKGHAHIYKCETGNRRVDIGEWIDWCAACGVDPKSTLDEVIKLRK